MKLKLEQPWKLVKAKLMEHNVELTDDDLHYEEGKDEELVQRLSAKMHRTKEEIKDWIESMSFNK